MTERSLFDIDDDEPVPVQLTEYDEPDIGSDDDGTYADDPWAQGNAALAELEAEAIAVELGYPGAVPDDDPELTALLGDPLASDEVPVAVGDVIADEGLFDAPARKPITLMDRFTVPPFSVLDARSGLWQDRKRRWLALGIKSEVGRDEMLTYSIRHVLESESYGGYGALSGTSTFDPVICELAYRWFSPHGGYVLDPFAGGSVRGIVASHLGRHYEGVDLRPEQIAANEAQLDIAGTPQPLWYAGDSLDVVPGLGCRFDLLFSCPPYFDLEVYSDDPRDLSTMDYPAFLDTYRHIIRASAAALRPNRFAVWVIGEVRDKRGRYRGLIQDTITAFADAGLEFYNEAILVTPVGTGGIRAAIPFEATRKLCNMHQKVLVFIKGDERAAVAAITGAHRA
jgi:hypothetical protein